MKSVTLDLLVNCYINRWLQKKELFEIYVSSWNYWNKYPQRIGSEPPCYRPAVTLCNIRAWKQQTYIAILPLKRVLVCVNK